MARWFAIWRHRASLWWRLWRWRRRSTTVAGAATPPPKVDPVAGVTALPGVVVVRVTPDDGGPPYAAIVPRRRRRPDGGGGSRLGTLRYRPPPLGTTAVACLEPDGVVATVTPADLGLDHLVVHRGAARYLLRAHDRAPPAFFPQA